MDNIIGRKRIFKQWEIEITDKHDTHYEIWISGTKRGEYVSYWILFHPYSGIKVWDGYGKIAKYLLREVYKLMKDVGICHTTKKYVSIKDKSDQLIDIYTV